MSKETKGAEKRLSFALRELFAGPSSQEIKSGLESNFSKATAKLINSVNVRDGAATVDLKDLNDPFPQLGATTATISFMAQLWGTTFAVSGIDSVTFTVEGDCEAFYALIEQECGATTREYWEASPVSP